MKTTIKTVIALAMLALGVNAFALDDPVNGFGVGSTNGGGALTWAIVPARSANNGTPAVTYLQCTADNATNYVTFYKVTAQCVGRYATNVTVTLSVDRTNGFASGDVIIIRHAQTENYEKRILTTMAASTNLVTTVAPLESVIPGDIIYRCTATGQPQILVGAATLALGPGQFVYVGQKGKPLLVEANGAAAVTLRAVGGVYLP